MNVYDGNGYTVDRPDGGDIRALRCQRCAFYVAVPALYRAGDKSGLGRYNRARGIMVKHIHAEHFEALGSEGAV